MAQQGEEVVLLRVSIDEGKTQERLQKLGTELRQTRELQKALNEDVKAGTVTQSEYEVEAERLRQKLRGQQQEQRALTRELELFRTASDSVTDSYLAQQAQLSLAQTQYQKLAGSAKDSTEETQALSAIIREIRGELKQVDASSLLQFQRDIGNYKGAFEDAVQQVVRLRGEEKRLAAGSKEAAANHRQQAGFLTAAQRAAAQAGKTYNEASKDIENYARSIQPATAELVKLEQEQARLVESGEEVSESFRKIGFQIGKLEKELKEVPVETKKVSDRLSELDATTGAFGGRISGLKESFTAAKGGFDVATQGLSGVRVAMLAVPLFAIIAGLTALYAWFTRTQEGADFVERKMKALSVVFGVVTDTVSAVGGAMVKAFDNPKQALQELGDFLLNNLLNRFKAIGVVLDGILNLDTRKIADGFIQAGTGIADATSKAQALGKELGAAAKAGEDIAREFQRIRDVERQINVERAQAKKDVEALKLLAEDVTKSTGERADAARRAFAIEQESNGKQLKAQQDRVANMEREAKLTNQLTEQNDALAAERIKLADLEAESLGRQTELNNKLNELRQLGLAQGLASTKAYYERLALEAQKGSQAELAARLGVIRAERDAQLAAQNLTENQRRLIITQSAQQQQELRQEYRRADLQNQLGLLDVELQQVQNNSDEQLNLLTRRLDTQHRLDLAQANLTLGQRKVLDAKFEADKLKLTVDFERQRSRAALQAQADTLQGELALLQDGAQQANEAAARGDAQAFEQAQQRNQRLYQLQRQAIGNELELQLAALDVRQDNTEKEYALRAAAQAKLAQLSRDYAAEEVERQRRQLDEQAQLLDLAAEDMLLHLSEQERRRVALSKGYVDERKKAILAERDALILGTREGSAERLRIEQETATKLRDLDEQTVAGRKQLYTELFNGLADLASNATNSLNTIQEAGKTQALARDEEQKRRQLVAAGDSAEKREAIEKSHQASQERIEKEFAEKRRKIQLAQVIINGAMAVSQILASPAVPFVEPFAAITRAVQIGLVAATTGAQVAAINSQRFQHGGTVLVGPSHQQGGIPFTVAGRPGFEAEGDEVILTKGVWRNPLLRPLASTLNQLGGGKPLLPGGRHLALGGVTSSALVRNAVRGEIPYNPAELGEVVADSLRRNPAVNRWSDFKDAQSRNEFTDQLSNS